MTRYTLCLLIGSLILTARAEFSELAKLQAEYGIKKESYDRVYEEGQAGINRKYALALDKMTVQAKRQGNLDLVLAIKNELKRFDGMAHPVDINPVRKPPELRRLQQQVKAAASKERDAYLATLLKLNLFYKGQLERLTKSLTQQDRIDDAVIVRKVIADLGLDEAANVASASARTIDPSKPLIQYSFDQVEGKQVKDESPYEHHADVLDGLRFEPGVKGQAAVFGAKGAGLYLPDEEGQYPTNDFSIACWILRGERGSGYLCDINYSDTNGDPELNAGIRLYFSATPEKANMPILTFFSEGRDGGAPNEVRGPVLQKHAWYHMALVRSGAKATCYVNGTVTATKDVSPAAVRYDGGKYDDNSVHLGAWKRKGFDGEKTWYDGSIDEFYLYPRAISAEEVRSLFARAQSAFE